MFRSGYGTRRVGWTRRGHGGFGLRLRTVRHLVATYVLMASNPAESGKAGSFSQHADRQFRDKRVWGSMSSRLPLFLHRGPVNAPLGIRFSTV